VADLVSFVVSVGGFACAVLVGCAWILASPRSSAPRRTLFAVAALYVFASIYAASYLAGQVLAAGYRPIEPSDVDGRPSAVVVLGSGSITARDWKENTLAVVDPVAASRVLEAARVYRLTRADWVISSGGMAHRNDTRVPAGIAMREALTQLGVPSARILVETQSANTHDEAVIVRSMLTALGVEHVFLVTSQFHMRRSVGAFRATGVTVTPAIARDPEVAGPWLEWLIPTERGLRHANAIAHEVLGVGYYALRGWYK
jgi:uncharacterized SAM-binding protein YcdF (DUF218 family)